MMAVTAMKIARGFTRVGLLIVVLLRKARTAIDRCSSAGAGAQLGGMRHRPRRHAEDEEKTDYDVKPPFHRVSV